MSRTISLIDMLMPSMTGRESEQKQTRGEEAALNLEIGTFTSCAVLNAKHVFTYCRAWLSQALGPFLLASDYGEA